MAALAVTMAFIRLGPAPGDATLAGSAEAAQSRGDATPLHGSCPTSFDIGAGAPEPTAIGPLAPAGALEATLCTYGLGRGGSVKTLATSQSRSDGADEVVSYLNGLPPGPGAGRTETGERMLPGCAAMDREAYRVVLTYADQPAIVVDINPNCATASRDGVVRSLSGLPGLLSLWPTG